MKVLHYINNLGSGGAEKLLSDILPLMKAKGIDAELMIANSKVNVEKFEKDLKDYKIKIINLNTSFYNPIQIYYLVKYIKKNNIDIVHAHLFPTQYWLAIASLFFKSKVKMVKTEHSVFNERKNYKVLLPLERFVYKKYDKIIAITEEVKSNLSSWLGSNSSEITTIQNGVNLNQIKEDQGNIQKVDYDFLNASSFNILMVGRFDGWSKDQETLVKSLAILPTNFKVYFAGEGSYLSEIKKKCETLGISDRVFFLGLRQDVYKIMNLVDLNVLSTNHEGLSGVVLESLASRKPFLGSNVVGVQEIVPDNRFLFTKGNEKELAEKILKIANDEHFKLELIEVALNHVEQFDIKYMVDDYLKLYDSM